MTIEQWSVTGYARMRDRLKAYCAYKSEPFDEDVFHLTLLKTLEREREQGSMADDTAEGIDNYVFRAFTVNTLRERQYPRNSRTTLTDDMTKYDRPTEDGDLYADACDEFGCDAVDGIIDGAPMDDGLRDSIIDYIKSYV